MLSSLLSTILDMLSSFSMMSNIDLEKFLLMHGEFSLWIWLLCEALEAKVAFILSSSMGILTDNCWLAGFCILALLKYRELSVPWFLYEALEPNLTSILTFPVGILIGNCWEADFPGLATFLCLLVDSNFAELSPDFTSSLFLFFMADLLKLLAGLWLKCLGDFLLGGFTGPLAWLLGEVRGFICPFDVLLDDTACIQNSKGCC